MSSDAPDNIRARHERLLKFLLVVPFFLVATAIVILSDQMSAGLFMSLACLMFALPWLTAGLLLSTGNFAAGEKGMLVICGFAIAGAITAAGGLASPLLFLALAIPAECYWITRQLRAVAAGLVVAVATAAVQLVNIPNEITIQSAHWIVPFAYLATLVWRVEPFIAGFHGQVADEDTVKSHVLDAMNAVFVRFGEGSGVLACSHQSKELLNVESTYLLGSGLFERTHIADRVTFMAALSDVRVGKTHSTVTLRLRVPSTDENISDRYEEFACEFVRTGAKREDVAAILRPNREAQCLRTELQAVAEKATTTEIAKSRFLATVSHELRTPLNAIIGFSDILLYEMYGKFSDDRQREYVDLIRQSGNHLLSVVNAVLDVSKIESGAYAIQPDAIDFKNAVKMCCSMLEHQAKSKNLMLIDHVSDDLPDVVADPRAIQQVLINLVSNAIKFTPEGGVVTIEAQVADGHLCFDVIDTGIGIEHEDIERLGNPFVQVQNDYTRNFEGTGLGLSLVKGLVELHDGSLSINSEPRKGTVATIKLPLAGPAEKNKSEVSSDKSEPNSAEQDEDRTLLTA